MPGRPPNHPAPADVPAMLADLIREARAVGMTNVDIARVCGVHETTVSRWISGAKSPSVGHLQPLADDLGMVLAPASG